MNDINRLLNAKKLLSLYEEQTGRAVPTPPAGEYPPLKVVQTMSKEAQAPFTVYRPGDLMLPYWTIRRPGTICCVIAGIDAVWERWVHRGSYLGESTEEPTPEEGIDVLSVGRVYVLSLAFGPLRARFNGLRLIELGGILQAMASAPNALEGGWEIMSQEIKAPDGISFFTARFSPCITFEGLEGLQERLKGLRS